MKHSMTKCSGCGKRFDRSRGYSGTVLNPFCTSRECTEKFLRNSATMAAAPHDLVLPFQAVNGFDNEMWAGQQRRLKG